MLIDVTSFIVGSLFFKEFEIYDIVLIIFSIQFVGIHSTQRAVKCVELGIGRQDETVYQI